jgi:glycogen synthase
MQVCIISSRFFPQIVGSGTSAYIMAMGLAERKHDVTVITDESLRQSHGTKSFPFKLLYVAGLENFAIGAASFRTPAVQLIECIRSVAPDIIHVCNFMPMFLVTILKHLIPYPTVFTFFNTPVKDKRAIGYFDKPELDLSLASYILTSHGYEKLILGSQNYIDSAVRLGAEPQKLKLSYLGIGELAFATAISAKLNLTLMQKYLGNQLSESDTYILLPSRITKQKGILEAVQALGEIHRKGDPSKLLLTGMATPFDPTYARLVLQEAERLGVSQHIVIPKQPISRDDLPHFFTGARVVIVPSWYEGLGLAAIEAQLIGAPLAVSAVAGLSEIVTHNETGLTFPPHDPHGIAAAVTQLTTDAVLAKKLVENAKVSVKKFATHDHISDLEDCYQELVREKF